MINTFQDIFEVLNEEPNTFTPAMKVCSECKVEKPMTEEYFAPHSSGGVGGFDTRCKPCKSHTASVAYNLKKRYPMPEDKLCQCCGNPGWATHGKRKSKHGIVLDHCHKTDSFRGWICQNCNVGIGKLGDDIAGLEMALRYLKNAEKYKNE